MFPLPSITRFKLVLNPIWPNRTISCQWVGPSSFVQMVNIMLGPTHWYIVRFSPIEPHASKHVIPSDGNNLVYQLACDFLPSRSGIRGYYILLKKISFRRIIAIIILKIMLFILYLGINFCRTKYEGSLGMRKIEDTNATFFAK